MKRKNRYKKELFCFMCLFFSFADQLGHGSHRAVNTPAPRLKQRHSDQAQNGGSQHYAVKTESKLRGARVEQGSMIGPVPGQLKGPEQRNSLLKISGSGKHKVSIPEHLHKHHQKEKQKTIAKNLAFHPSGNIFFSGKAKASAQKSEQLPSSAVAVASSPLFLE